MAKTATKSQSMKHWYPRYPADYAQKTRHLSLMEHGAYALLMDHYYSTEKPLPANIVQLHRICIAFAPEEQEALQTILNEFFILKEDGYHNSRINEEISKKKDISEKRRKVATDRHKKDKKEVKKQAAIACANAGAIADTSTSTSTSTYNNINNIDLENEIIAKYTNIFLQTFNGYVNQMQPISKAAKNTIIDIHRGLMKNDFNAFEDVCKKALENDYYIGKNKYNFLITLEWLANEKNVVKILNERPRKGKSNDDYDDILKKAAEFEEELRRKDEEKKNASK